MRKIFWMLMFALVILVGFARETEAQTSHVPGFTSVHNTVPTPVSRSGISGSIIDGYGNPVKDAELVVSIEKFDSDYNQYVDLGSSKRYGACASAGATDCVQSNGHYDISLTSLPRDGEDLWWWINVRAIATNGFVQGIWDARRVQIQADGRVENLAPIYMYDYGFKIDTPKMWYVDPGIIAIGMWVRSNDSMDVSVGFSFEGSSWTKMSTNYARVNTSQHVENGQTYLETWFYAPQNTNMSYYNGAFCGEVQITSTYTPEWVFDNSKKVCVRER